MERFGFIHGMLEIKVLILYILNRLPEPVGMDLLTELALCDNGVTYFDFAEALSDLVSSGHVYERDGLYMITDKGAHNGSAAETTVPYSVRMKAEAAALDVSQRLRRDSMIRTYHDTTENGVVVHASLSDGIGNILNMDILAGNDRQALIFERNFNKNAEQIYNSIVGILQGGDS
jgi:hypothetical protein